jgi:hypothetical protein
LVPAPVYSQFGPMLRGSQFGGDLDELSGDNKDAYIQTSPVLLTDR